MTGSLVVTDTVTHLSTTVPLTGNGVNPPGAMSGLAYYLPFTDGTGTTVHDASGNGRDGTLAGSGTPAVWYPTGLAINGQTSIDTKRRWLPDLRDMRIHPYS